MSTGRRRLPQTTGGQHYKKLWRDHQDHSEKSGGDSLAPGKVDTLEESRPPSNDKSTKVLTTDPKTVTAILAEA